MRGILCLLLMAWSLAGWAAQMTMHVISRPDAEALVPVIGPLLVEDGTVNAYQGKLIIRTTAQNFSELQSVLGELNSKPKAVTVYLRRAGSSSEQRLEADVELSHKTFSGSSASVQIQQQRRQINQHSDYQVRTLSGYPAGINQGTLLALSRGDNATYLHSLKRGIQVIPQVNMDGSVTLQIQQRHDQPGGPGIADTQHSSSTLRLQPGQWQQMGAINTVNHNQQRRIGSYQTSRQVLTLPIEVMVEVNE